MSLLRSLLTLVVLLNVDVAVADNSLSSAELYAKCYAKITDHPVELDSSDYKLVVSGKLDPITACMKVFKKAEFTVSGNKRSLPDTNDDISKSILRNFHQFHLSWFTNNLDAGSVPAANFIDMNEPALYITDALFSKKHFKTVVTSKEPLRGIRSAGNPETYVINGRNMTKNDFFIGPIGETGKPLLEDYRILANNDRVTLGTLTGIMRAPSKVVPLPRSLKGGAAPLSVAQQAANRLEVTSYNMTQHYGGGVLGSVANFYTNDEVRRPLDGGLRVHRRWANNNFYDLMCAKLPSLKETDAVVTNAFNQFKNSTLPFRRSKTCLSCHVTLDNFAHAARNIEGRQLDNNTFRREVQALHPELTLTAIDLIFKSPVTQPAIPLNDDDDLYHRRPPEGKLVYRNFNGKLINESVEGLQELGEKVAVQDDIYMCAAKRYYSFLTGVDVSMAPIAVDATTKKPKDADKFDYYHRQIVVGLSKRLKTSGSVESLIQDILKTKAFQSRNPAMVGDK